MTQDHKHYRYCFSCEKWKTKEEINEIDLGPQPGGGNGKSYNCDTCHKDLGETIQIFRCPDHEEEILKVWGTLEGVNQEKIFYQECPQKQQQEPSFWDKIPAPAKIGGGIITFLLGLLVTFKLWFNNKVEKVEDQLKTVKEKFTKKKENEDDEQNIEIVEPKNNQEN